MEEKGNTEMRRLRAHYGRLRKSDQRSRAQSRANSGALVAVKEGIIVEESEAVSFSGNVQITKVEASGESWFSVVDGAGAAGAGLESGKGWLTQQLQ